MEHDYDVVIVGARVGGSILAAFLGDAGHRVLLVDKGKFPSPTLSTHFFRGAGMISILNRLGVLERVLELKPPLLIQQYYYMDGGVQPIIQPPQSPGEAGYCLSVRREPLDQILVERACLSPKVHLRTRTSLIHLVQNEGRVEGVQLKTPDGEQTVSARIVIGADGRHSTVAKLVQPTNEEASEGSRFILYCYVRNFHGVNGSADGPEFSIMEDEIAYVFPSDSGITCIALSMNIKDYDGNRKSTIQLFQDKIKRHKGIFERFEKANLEGNILFSRPETNYVRVPVGPGWAMVGDAGLHQDPWSGHGMDMASTHASFLAESLNKWFSNSLTESEALEEYHLRRNKHALATYRMTVGLSSDLSVLAKQL